MINLKLEGDSTKGAEQLIQTRVSCFSSNYEGDADDIHFVTFIIKRDIDLYTCKIFILLDDIDKNFIVDGFNTSKVSAAKKTEKIIFDEFLNKADENKCPHYRNWIVDTSKIKNFKNAAKKIQKETEEHSLELISHQ